MILTLTVRQVAEAVAKYVNEEKLVNVPVEAKHVNFDLAGRYDDVELGGATINLARAIEDAKTKPERA